MSFPDKESCLDVLSHVREVKFGIWEMWASHDGVDVLRDKTEKEVRTLDFLMEAIRRNDII